MFDPPHCPYSACAFSRDPPARFFLRLGHYPVKCRAHPVPRFRCRGCRRSFSRQTFRVDYRDHRPDLNAGLFRLLASGLGLRQSGRLLHLSVNAVQRKFRKLARQLALFHHHQLRRGALDGGVFLLDEMVTFETDRRAQPLTLPIVIEEESMFIVHADCDTLPPVGKKSVRSRQSAGEPVEGGLHRRRNRSRRCVRRTLARVKWIVKDDAPVLLVADQKKTYPGIAREVFGERVLVEQHSSKLPRDTKNPLFRINLTNAMARDLNGRLRRRSWLASKRRRFLRLQLAVFTCYRNYQRVRFNADGKKRRETPAQILGLTQYRWSFEQMLAWRQDFGRRSRQPLAA